MSNVIFIIIVSCLPILFSCGSEDNTSNLKKIIGSDDRTIVNNKDYRTGPFGAVGKLFVYEAGSKTFDCTATLISRRFIVTAAHCVYKPGESNKFDGWSFYTGYRNGEYLEKVRVSNVWTGYDSQSRSNIAADWAIMKLEKSIRKSQPVRISTPSNKQLRSSKVTFIGYGGYGRFSDRMGVQRGCDIAEIRSGTFGHKCDTEQGSSGGPLFNEKSELIGIQKGASSGLNVAVRLNNALKKYEMVK